MSYSDRTYIIQYTMFRKLFPGTRLNILICDARNFKYYLRKYSKENSYFVLISKKRFVRANEQ